MMNAREIELNVELIALSIFTVSARSTHNANRRRSRRDDDDSILKWTKMHAAKTEHAKIPFQCSAARKPDANIESADGKRVRACKRAKSA